MAEVFGSVSSAIALAQLAGKVATSTYKYISEVKKAPKDLDQLLLELSSLTTILINLCGNWKTGLTKANAPSDRDVGLPECFSQLHILLKELYEKLAPWYGMKGRIFRRFTWPFQAQEVSEYLTKLERHKSTLRTALSADQRYAEKRVYSLD